jgi:trimethyllysine dioxygenase
MCGAYIGADEYRSKLAVLKEKFEQQVKGDAAAVYSDGDVGGRSVWSPNL